MGAARWRLLYLISQQPLVSQKRLVQQVRVDPGSITRQLSALQHDGLIERSDDPRDTRLTRVRLTAAGQSEVRRVMRLRKRFLDRMIQGLPEAEVQTCMAVLDAICRNLGDEEPVPMRRRRATPVGPRRTPTPSQA